MNQRFTHSTTPLPRPPAESHTFSAKEKDVETGLSVTSLRSVSSSSLSQYQTSLAWHSLIRRFGSRYYSSDLSIWLSVDPMSDKYPSLSPYTYCADNPVKLVDPDGEDWFENELTGDVYYSKYLTKDDVSHIEGEGWKWMGKNDMFGSSPTQLILVDHFDKSTFVNCDQKGIETALFNGKNAKNFMSDMGYEFMPTKLEVAITKYQQMADVDLSGAPKYIYYQQTSEKALKSEYIPKTATASYSVLSRTKYVDKPLGFHVWKTTWTETRQYSYSTSDLMKYGNAMKQLLPKMMELYKDFESLHMESLIRRKYGFRYETLLFIIYFSLFHRLWTNSQQQCRNCL
jgi:RHS repeat-associated protein